MSERFSAQLALVAGGTGGLGRAVSIEFLEEGATVVDPESVFAAERYQETL